MKRDVPKSGNASKHSKSTHKTRELPVIKTTWALLFLMGITLLMYGRTANYSFTWFDDEAILIRNQSYISDGSHLPEAFLRDAEFQKRSIELYRPLQNISFITDAAIGGFSAETFHRSQLLLFMLVVGALYFLLREVGGAPNIALAGATVMAVHPIAAYTVGWLPARGDLLLALTSLTAIVAFIRYAKTRRHGWLYLHIFTFLLALLSKESGVVIPVICGLWYVLVFRGKLRTPWLWLLAMVYLVFIGFYLYIRSLSIAPTVAGTFGAGALIHHLPFIPEVLKAFFLPWRTPTTPFYSTVPTVAGLIIIAILTFAAFRKKGDKAMIWFSALWFILYLLPSMFYQPLWSDYIYDYLLHRSFLPLTGILILIITLFKDMDNKLFRMPGLLVTMLLILVMAVTGFRFSGVFAHQESFWTYTAATNPESSFAHNYLGNVYFFNQQPEKAVESYTKALEIRPDKTEAMLNRGIAHASLKHQAEALADFNHVLQIHPEDTTALRYRGHLYFETGEYARAMADFSQLMDSGESVSTKVLFQYALSHLLTNQYRESQQLFRDLQARTGEQAHYLRLAALADLMAGDTDASIEKNLRAMILEPPAQQTLTNLGYAYWEKGEYQLSLDHFIRAQDAGAMNLSIALGLWIAHHQLGNRSEEIRAGQLVRNLKPALLTPGATTDLLVKEGYLLTPSQIREINLLLRSLQRSTAD